MVIEGLLQEDRATKRRLQKVDTPPFLADDTTWEEITAAPFWVDTNTIAMGLNLLPGYSTQTKVIVGGRGNLNVAASHGVILGGDFLTLEPRDTATFYGGEPGFYGPNNDVGIGSPGKVYLGSSANPQFLLTGEPEEE
jgi:hypothetical protein